MFFFSFLFVSVNVVAAVADSQFSDANWRSRLSGRRNNRVSGSFRSIPKEPPRNLEECGEAAGSKRIYNTNSQESQ